MTAFHASDCPFCGTMQNAATRIARPEESPQQLPEPGNVSICGKCFSLSVFDDKLNRRRPTAAEQQEFDAMPGLQRVLARLREVGPHP